MKHERSNPDSDPSFGDVVRCWQRASRELRFEIESPYVLVVDDESFWCVAYLPHFSCPTGVVLALLEDSSEFYASRIYHLHRSRDDLNILLINPEVYGRYDRELFSASMREWGFCGPAHLRPSWA
jgi:hypothetical protein